MNVGDMYHFPVLLGTNDKRNTFLTRNPFPIKDSEGNRFFTTIDLRVESIPAEQLKRMGISILNHGN